MSARGIGLSILDRLRGEEQPRPERIRDGLRRDLEDLLNTPRRVTGWPDALALLDRSLLDFGVVDLSTVNLSTEQRRAAVVEEMARTIRAFEPRLSGMRMEALPNADPADRTLRIRIEAEIAVAADPELMIFDTVVDPVANTIRLASPLP